LNDVTFAPDGSAFVTDSVNPVLYRMVPDGTEKYRLEEYIHWNAEQLGRVRAPGAAGINFNGLVVTPDGKYLILSKRNDSGLYRFDIATKEIVKVAVRFCSADNRNWGLLRTSYRTHETTPLTHLGQPPSGGASNC
jgi:sugar lactone lactonase YvrE